MKEETMTLTAHASFPVGDSTGWIIDGEWPCDDNGCVASLSNPCSCDFGPPPVATEAIGKPCETCEGPDGLVGFDVGPDNSLIEHLAVAVDRARTDRCDTCAGSGRAVIELTVPCPHPDCEEGLMSDAWLDANEPFGDGWQGASTTCIKNCDDGHVTVRVIPEQVVPIYGWSNPDWFPEHDAVLVDSTNEEPPFLFTYDDRMTEALAEYLSEHVGRFVIIGKEVKT